MSVNPGKASAWKGSQGGVLDSLDVCRTCDPLEELEAQLAEQIEEAARFSSAACLPSVHAEKQAIAGPTAPQLQGESRFDFCRAGPMHTLPTQQG